MKPKSKSDARLDAEAAEWFVHWDDQSKAASAKDQKTWIAWLQRSADNVEGYFEIAAIFDRLKTAKRRVSIDDWLAEDRSNVSPLARGISPCATARAAKSPARDSRHGRRIAMTASVVAVVLTGLLLGWLRLSDPVARTGLGEQSSFTLSDGSTIRLNTESKVRISFSPSQRLIDLDGEALFTVAHDTSRPFYVRTHTATARAVGTQFNVYARDSETRVSVVQGIVQVSTGPLVTGAQPDPTAAAGTIALSAGEEARVSTVRVTKEREPNVANALAWEANNLVFRDTPLADVAREFNRYNTLQFSMTTDVGQAIRISGTFNAKHPQSLVLFLQGHEGISVTRNGNEVFVK